jgi:pimeloyl-ACP methyl ester carboxylesterase
MHVVVLSLFTCVIGCVLSLNNFRFNNNGGQSSNRQTSNSEQSLNEPCAHQYDRNGKFVKCLKNPLERMNVSAIVRHYGYRCEDHDVITEDGYILTVQRILPSRNKRRNEPVYLQHGLLDSSFAWVANMPNQSLAYMLADDGYDVWLGNSRGNYYGKRHVRLTTHDDKFWDFSLDEMAHFDVPATTNYILKYTGHSQLHYVAHSQGTMIAFIEFGRDHELGAKIKSYHALAPVAAIGHIKGGLKILSNIAPQVKFLYDILGYNEFFSKNWLFRYLGDIMCAITHISKAFCGNLIFTLIGFDKKNLNLDRLPVYTAHTPAGTSVRNMVHFIQMIKNGRFEMYNFGEEENLRRYNQTTPPQYDVSLMKVPVHLYTGTNDWLADPYDFSTSLLPKLPNIARRKNIDAYNHLDFTWGLDAHELVYKDVMQSMKDLD